jgi:hypothetical protein
MATPGGGNDEHWSATGAAELPPPSLWDPLVGKSEEDNGFLTASVGKAGGTARRSQERLHRSHVYQHLHAHTAVFHGRGRPQLRDDN